MHKREIDPKRWYLVDLRKQTREGNYYLLMVSFKSKKEAKRVMEANISEHILYFDVIKGEEALEFRFHLPQSKEKSTYLDYLRKYDYGPELETRQQRKSFRTKYRRWKRNYKKELTNGWV